MPNIAAKESEVAVLSEAFKGASAAWSIRYR